MTAASQTDYQHFTPARFAPAMFRYRKSHFAPDPTCFCPRSSTFIFITFTCIFIHEK